MRIRQHGKAIILEPLAQDWHWLDRLTEELDTDFMQAATEQPDAQTRPEIDKLFQ